MGRPCPDRPLFPAEVLFAGPLALSQNGTLGFPVPLTDPDILGTEREAFRSTDSV